VRSIDSEHILHDTRHFNVGLIIHDKIAPDCDGIVLELHVIAIHLSISKMSNCNIVTCRSYTNSRLHRPSGLHYMRGNGDTIAYL